MKPRQRRWRGVRLAVIPMVAGLLLAAGLIAPAIAASDGAAVPVLKWGACREAGETGFDCATARVPLDYRQPKGAAIALAVIRHRATRPAQRVGALFFNSGGSGGSGGSGVRSLVDWLPRFPAILTERFDLISWDPRGFGASTAVRCFETPEAGFAFFAALPAGFPVGPTQSSIWQDTYARFGVLCGERNATLLQHLSTADSARDLELLRQAVGEPTMTYYGVSWGTLLGASYANLFPGAVRAMVLDGNIDPVAWTQTGRHPPLLSTALRLQTDFAVNRALAAFLDQCAAAGATRCAFADADATTTQAKFATLLERVRARPIPFNGEAVTYAALVSTVADMIAVVPAGGGFPGWSGAAEFLETLWTGGSGGTPPPQHYDDREQGVAVRCGESPNPRYPGYYRALAAFAFERAGDVGSRWAWTDEPCAGWPAIAADPYRGPWDHRTASPVLVIGTTNDPVTAYEGSLAMAAELARARLLTVDGYGHTALLNPSTCANDDVSRYVLSGTLPPPGTVCRQDATPFGGEWTAVTR